MAEEVACTSSEVDVRVDIIDYAYMPMDVRAEEGQVIQFTNTGATEHTVTSGTPGDTDVGEAFDSGDLEPGDTFCMEVSGEGVVPFHCEYHPEQMRAMLTAVLEGDLEEDEEEEDEGGMLGGL